ncbi:hypothetical protein D9619_012493 [Psilocybe cf. subviscida]|uniref:Nephrocystin 3-like N-terminal domain-containing protein n=1 Tax=Psilocybe cf. subviscida TaxID=2480587 RepID=A0A8H5ERD3_9AGAR|nr:hypothetical protein D9619_012493 [Psilocybe cf. subviscida]
MDAQTLAHWMRFSQTRGIGQCVAIQYTEAAAEEALMFLKGDVITVLSPMPLNITPSIEETKSSPLFLGYCEKVVGLFNSRNVWFITRLQRPFIVDTLNVRQPCTQSVALVNAVNRENREPTQPVGFPAIERTLCNLLAPSYLKTSTRSNSLSTTNAPSAMSESSCAPGELDDLPTSKSPALEAPSDVARSMPDTASKTSTWGTDNENVSSDQALCPTTTATMFTKASNFTISGGTFVIHSSSTSSNSSANLDLLHKHVAPNAILNAGGRADRAQCYPGTRKDVISRIDHWIKSNHISDRGIFWLSGPAGAGKSAIVQTIAECCIKDRISMANFFFFRADPSRNNSRSVVSTL